MPAFTSGVQDPAPIRRDEGIVESIHRSDLGHWSPRRLGVPALLDWWPSYVAIGGAAVLVLLATARTLFEILVPLAHVIVVFTFAAALTFALTPVVDRLEPIVRSRTVAVLSIAAFVLIAFGVLATAIVTGVAQESSRLSQAIIEYTEAVNGERPLMLGDRPLAPAIAERVRGIVESQGPDLAARTSGLVFAVAATIVDAALVLVLAVYLLIDARRARLLMLRALQPRHRGAARRVIREVARVFGAYLRAQVVLALSVAIAVAILLSVLQVPYALLLGVFAGLAELIPMLGPFIAAVPALAVAAAQPFPTVVLAAVGLIVIQQLESSLLMPRLIGGAIGLHPVVALLALIAGFQIAGPVGALIAVPVVGLVWVFVSTAVLAWRGRRIEFARRQGRRPWRPRRRLSEAR